MRRKCAQGPQAVQNAGKEAQAQLDDRAPLELRIAHVCSVVLTFLFDLSSVGILDRTLLLCQLD